jgi:serine/threonine protein kinase
LKTFCGTADYVAPEVLSQKLWSSSHLDRWAFAVTVYQMLAGYTPFRGRDAEEVFMNTLMGMSVSLHSDYGSNRSHNNLYANSHQYHQLAINAAMNPKNNCRSIVLPFSLLPRCQRPADQDAQSEGTCPSSTAFNNECVSFSDLVSIWSATKHANLWHTGGETTFVRGD